MHCPIEPVEDTIANGFISEEALLRAKEAAFQALSSAPRNGAPPPETLTQAFITTPSLEMNGLPLPAAHGAPLRAVVPAYIGARSVKWLGEIHVQSASSDNYFQRRAYKRFGFAINQHESV